MAPWQHRPKRKMSGGKLHTSCKKRKHELGRPAIETQLGNRKLKVQRVLGGNIKLKLFKDEKANVIDPKTNKAELLEITHVVENKASLDLHRRAIITKGTIIETPKGNARVTSRPGQCGIINAVLIQ
ncbi:MAG TPA: 30S ribosomal protein S8e [Candidatus Lokiarchaeia archaeon]|nr:30S ribosomal protein S8e [Candidatus Lokiarchaeia archaeon]